MKLFTRYLNSAAYFEGNNDQGSEQKTPAQIEREKIAAGVVTAQTDDEGDKDKDKEQEEDNNDKDDEEDEGDKEEDDKEGEGEKDPPANETEDQKKERLAAEKQSRAQSRMQRRIDRLTADNNLTKQENERLKKQLEANPEAKLTEEEVQARAEKLAADIVKNRTNAEIRKQFENDCDEVQGAAIKADKEFMNNINAAAQEVAPIPGLMIGVLKDLDNENGGEVLAYLAKNVDVYETMFRDGVTDQDGNMVPISEGRMTAKLIRISDKLKADAEAAKAAKKKERSKVPDPITPVNEGRDARSSTVLPANPTKSAEDMQKFVELRNQQVAARRKANGGLL